MAKKPAPGNDDKDKSKKDPKKPPAPKPPPKDAGGQGGDPPGRSGGIQLFDDEGDVAYQATISILRAVHNMVADHLLDLFKLGASSVQAQAVAQSFVRAVTAACTSSVDWAVTRAAIEKAMRDPEIAKLPPPMIEVVRQAAQQLLSMGASPNTVGPMLNQFAQMLGSINPAMLGGMMGGPMNFSVGGAGAGVFQDVDKDVEPKDGMTLVKWAHACGVADELTGLVGEMGIKGSPMQWSDEAVHSLYLKLKNIREIRDSANDVGFN